MGREAPDAVRPLFESTAACTTPDWAGPQACLPFMGMDAPQPCIQYSPLCLCRSMCVCVARLNFLFKYVSDAIKEPSEPSDGMAQK